MFLKKVLLFVSPLLFTPLFSVEYSKAEMDLMFNMSLEELMNIRVTTATKTSEKLSKAPSSMTVFKQDRINNMGIENVYDLLNFVPGFQVTRDVDIIAEPSIHTRGVTSLNGYVLIMINGFRYNEVAWSRSTMHNNYIPTSNVKRVEIIRGPGSALYGSNAYLGIINIITDDKQNSISLQSGSYNKQHLSGNFYKPYSFDSSISASIDFNKDDGEDFAQNGEDPSEHLNLSTKFVHKNSSLQLYYTHQKLRDFLQFNSRASNQNWSKSSTFKAMFNHDIEFSDRLNLNTMLSYSRYDIDVLGLFREAAAKEGSVKYDQYLLDLKKAPNLHDMYIGPYTQSSSYDADMKLEYKISDKHHLIGGFVLRREGVDYQGANTNYIAPDRSLIAPKEAFYTGEVKKFKEIGQLDSQEKYINIYSLYAQYRAIISDKLTSFLGVRYDNYSLGGNSINPRASLIYSYDDDTTLKLLYATAFRAPTNKELFANSPRSVGNEQLDPENVATTELVFSKKLNKSTFDITLFHSRLDDIIRGDIKSRTDNRFTNENFGARTVEGVEGSLMYRISDEFHLYATHSHIFSKIEPQNYKDISSLTVNYAQPKYNVNLNGIFRKQQENVLTGQGDYALVNAHLKYNLSSNANVTFSIDNLFDEHYLTYAPRLTTLNNAVVNRGRTWRFGIKKTW